MIKRRLGADGPEITAVGYGSMSFGAAYGPTTHQNSVAILDAMQDLGLDHFDTAYIYAGGEAETIFGDYCRQSPAARDFFSVATKGGIFTGPAADNDGFANNNSRDFLTAQLVQPPATGHRLCRPLLLAPLGPRAHPDRGGDGNAGGVCEGG